MSQNPNRFLTTQALITELEDKAVIQPLEFRSRLPLVARIRTVWNNVAARWYVQWQFNQQIAFNQLAVRQKREQQKQVEELYAQVVDQDEMIVQLSHTIADLERQIKLLKYSAENSAK